MVGMERGRDSGGVGNRGNEVLYEVRVVMMGNSDGRERGRKFVGV